MSLRTRTGRVCNDLATGSNARHADQADADLPLKELAACFESEKRALWRAGDLISQLMADHLWSISDLARKLDHPRVRLNETYKTAAAFPRGTRDMELPFFRHEQARKVAEKFKTFGLSPVAALREIVARKLTKTKAITRHFATMFQSPVPPAPSSSTAVIDSCHRCDFRELLPRIDGGSVHLLFFDPPFLPRPGVKAGKVAGTGKARTECDGCTEEEALKLTVNILEGGSRVLAPGGALILCQPSGIVDFRIHQAIHDHGWFVEAELHWNKGRPRPGNGVRPYSTQLEKMLVLVPHGVRARCFGSSLHSDLLAYSPVSIPGSAPRSMHVLQKPQKLCQFLVRQHSPFNGLVVDACGCSGAMALAAIAEGRHWIYCEPNKTNFEWGSHRILSAASSNQTIAA